MPKKPVGLNKPAGFLIQLESGQIMNFIPNVIRVNASVRCQSYPGETRHSSDHKSFDQPLFELRGCHIGGRLMI